MVLCDIGGEPDAEHWIIRTPEGLRVTLDLCEKHSQSLRRMLTAVPQSGKVSHSGRTKEVVVTDPADIEKLRTKPRKGGAE